MFKAFEIAGYKKEEVMEKFGGMVNAFSYWSSTTWRYCTRNR
jgi:aspartyl-tRNA synthetase